MADGGERPPKRARKNIDMVVESEGASGNSEDGPVSGSFARSRVGPSQNSESSEDRDEPEDRGDLQRLLGAEPPLPEHPTAAATEMIAVARKNAPGLRDWLLAQAKKSASCACTQPRPRWSKDHPQATSTCGHENAGEVASISMKVSDPPRRIGLLSWCAASIPDGSLEYTLQHLLSFKISFTVVL